MDSLIRKLITTLPHFTAGHSARRLPRPASVETMGNRAMRPQFSSRSGSRAHSLHMEQTGHPGPIARRWWCIRSALTSNLSLPGFADVHHFFPNRRRLQCQQTPCGIARTIQRHIRAAVHQFGNPCAEVLRCRRKPLSITQLLSAVARRSLATYRRQSRVLRRCSFRQHHSPSCQRAPNPTTRTLSLLETLAAQMPS